MTEQINRIREASKRALKDDPTHLAVTAAKEDTGQHTPARPGAESQYDPKHLWPRRLGEKLDQMAKKGRILD